MSQGSVFVPKAIATCQEIRQLMIQIETKARVLRADYVQGGGDNMPGLAEVDWANNYNITFVQFKAGMLDIAAAHNAINLSTLFTAGGFDDVTIVAGGE